MFRGAGKAGDRMMEDGDCLTNLLRIEKNSPLEEMTAVVEAVRQTPRNEGVELLCQGLDVTFIILLILLKSCTSMHCMSRRWCYLVEADKQKACL